MPGYLDKKSQIIDMVLTNEGKRLLSKGNLRFAYFALFDDEVDYDPVIVNSGSLTAEQLSGSIYEQIEATLVREASHGYQLSNSSGSDFVNVNRPLFTMPQGQHILPRMTSTSGTTVEISVQQRKIQDMHIQLDEQGNIVQSLGPYDRGYERYNPSNLTFYFIINDFNVDEHHREGFLVRVFQSGTEGLVEVGERRDLNNDITFNNDLKLSVIAGSKKNVG